MKRDPLHKALVEMLGSTPLRRLPQVLVVACSGGADSVALLVAAAEAAPASGWRVEALHCDHGLRREAKRDAALVAALCERLSVPLHPFATKLGKGAGMEARARAWRQRCYARAARAAGARLVLLGHHAQDQAETVLLNLVRGAGPRGAAGMRALSPLQGATGIHLGRPFLGLIPAQLRQALKARRQAWREDRSNRDTKLARNRIRHEVLPVLRSINWTAVEHIASFARGLGKPRAEDLGGLLKLDRAARARAQALLERGHGQADLGRGWTLRLSSDQSLVERAPSALTLRPGEAGRWGDWRFQLKLGVPDARKLRQDNAFWFSSGLARLRIRAPRAGERLELFGRSSGSKLLRDILAEAKVPVWQRGSWPVLEHEGRILGLPPWRRGKGLEAQPGQKALCLTWKTAPRPLAGQA